MINKSRPSQLSLPGRGFASLWFEKRVNSKATCCNNFRSILLMISQGCKAKETESLPTVPGLVTAGFSVVELVASEAAPLHYSPHVMDEGEVCVPSVGAGSLKSSSFGIWYWPVCCSIPRLPSAIVPSCWLMKPLSRSESVLPLSKPWCGDYLADGVWFYGRRQHRKGVHETLPRKTSWSNRAPD